MTFQLEKRLFDLVIAGPSVIILSPLLIFIGILVRMKIGSPVLFRQTRPELFNVIKGDMSIVGPRPLLMQYLDRYTLEQARRHEVKPEITGWAQVNGRNARFICSFGFEMVI